jgi:hypothetical protein
MSGRPAAMLPVGLGLGAIAGAYLHMTAAWTGLALIMVGIGVAIAGGSRTADGTASILADPGREPAAGRPGLRGLGTRVEQILRLAEMQANDRRAIAEREARRIVADAQAEARTIIEKAQQQAP